MNQFVRYAKCSTIRDAQLEEKKAAHRPPESAGRSARKDVFAPPLCVGLPGPRLPARRGTVGLGAPRMGDFSLAPAAEPPGAMSERALRDEGNAREPPERAP